MACLPTTSSQGENLVRVEEDWELIVGDPGPWGGMPQITTTMSPVGDLEGLRMLFTLNLDGAPEYESGGMRVMAWESNTPGPAKRFGVGTPLRVRNERITWTQVMSIERGGLSFAIVNGKSETWGEFGQGNALRLKVRSRVANLNDYSQDSSYYCSGVSGRRLTPTRVQTLLLRQVRWYSPEGLAYQDNDLRVVY